MNINMNDKVINSLLLTKGTILIFTEILLNIVFP